MGIGGGLTTCFGHEQVMFFKSETDANLFEGHAGGTEGKFGGIAPRSTRASRHRNAFLILLEVYISCFDTILAPEESFVATSAKIPPSTPKSSAMAPRIVNLTGTISDFATPKAKTVLRGTTELWHPESAIIGISSAVGVDAASGNPSLSWSSGKGVIFAVKTG